MIGWGAVVGDPWERGALGLLRKGAQTRARIAPLPFPAEKAPATTQIIEQACRDAGLDAGRIHEP